MLRRIGTYLGIVHEPSPLHPSSLWRRYGGKLLTNLRITRKWLKKAEKLLEYSLLQFSYRNSFLSACVAISEGYRIFLCWVFTECVEVDGDTVRRTYLILPSVSLANVAVVVPHHGADFFLQQLIHLTCFGDQLLLDAVEVGALDADEGAPFRASFGSGDKHWAAGPGWRVSGCRRPGCVNTGNVSANG